MTSGCVIGFQIPGSACDETAGRPGQVAPE